MTDSVLDDALNQLASIIKHTQRLKDGAHQALVNNPGNRKFHKDQVQADNRERLSERMFVRSFGDKVKKVRYGGRADFVGLTLLGKYQGFTITLDDSGARKVRLIDIDEEGRSHVTHRYLRVKDNESVSNLQRGLLKWVR